MAAPLLEGSNDAALVIESTIRPQEQQQSTIPTKSAPAGPDKEAQASSPPTGEPKPPSRQGSPRASLSTQPQSAPLQQRSITASEIQDRIVAMETADVDEASPPRKQLSAPELPQSSLQEAPPDAGSANEAT